MNIIDDRPGANADVALSSLSVGSAFLRAPSANPILRTDFINPSGKIGCADLSSGQFAVLDPALLVTPIDAVVHIK